MCRWGGQAGTARAGGRQYPTGQADAGERYMRGGQHDRNAWHGAGYDDAGADRSWASSQAGYAGNGGGGYCAASKPGGRYVGDKYQDFDDASWAGAGASYHDYDYDGARSSEVQGRGASQYGNIAPERMHYDYDDVGGDTWGSGHPTASKHAVAGKPGAWPTARSQ